MREVFDGMMANLKTGDTATANMQKWEPSTWPSDTKGVGFGDAPRGALGHWVHIQDGKIANYQAIVPSTWNASPRDAAGNIGAYEAALLGTPMADPSQPLEILRTIHSFDPCLACASHVMSPDGQELATVKIR
jgi:hydrogenase large subunit